jgi:hypothetical protein
LQRRPRCSSAASTQLRRRRWWSWWASGYGRRRAGGGGQGVSRRRRRSRRRLCEDPSSRTSAPLTSLRRHDQLGPDHPLARAGQPQTRLTLDASGGNRETCPRCSGAGRRRRSAQRRCPQRPASRKTAGTVSPEAGPAARKQDKTSGERSPCG